MEIIRYHFGSSKHHRIRLVLTLLAALFAMKGCARDARFPPSGSRIDGVEESWVHLFHLETKEDKIVVHFPRRIPLPALTTMAIGIAFGGELIELTQAESIAGHRRLKRKLEDDSEEWFLIRGQVPIELFREALATERISYAPLRKGASPTSGLYSDVTDWNLLPARITSLDSSAIEFARCRVKRRIWINGLPPGSFLALCEVVVPLSVEGNCVDSFLTIGLAILEHDVIRLGPNDLNYEVVGAWAKRSGSGGEFAVSTTVGVDSNRNGESTLVQLYCFGEEANIPVLPNEFELPPKGWTGIDWQSATSTLAERAARVGNRLRHSH